MKSAVDNLASLKEMEIEVAEGLSNRKLYFTDGTLPNYGAKQLSEDSPGLSCEINDGANQMLPLMLRSNRPESLLNFMKVLFSLAEFSLFWSIYSVLIYN